MTNTERLEKIAELKESSRQISENLENTMENAKQDALRAQRKKHLETVSSNEIQFYIYETEAFNTLLIEELLRRMELEE